MGDYDSVYITVSDKYGQALDILADKDNDGIYETSILDNVSGDANGDGCIDVFDMITARKCLLKEETIADLYSMDMDFSGDISVADIVMLEKYLLGR